MLQTELHWIKEILADIEKCATLFKSGRILRGIVLFLSFFFRRISDLAKYSRSKVSSE